MSGIFLTMNTAKRGLFAQQQAVSTAGHNIANANTDGYSRQRVELVTTPGYRIPNVGMVGTGVDISTIARVRDSYLDVQIRYETSIGGQYKARQEILEQIETAFLEPGENGLSEYMGKMWDAWQQLSNTPEGSSSARTIVRDNSLTLTDSMNHLYRQLDTLKADSISLEEKKVLDIESTLEQIKDLNSQIFKIKISGDEPNDLLDKRDLLLDKLSEIIDFTATEDGHGRVTITHKSGVDVDGKDHYVTLLGTEKGNEIPKQMSVVRSVEEVKDTESGNVTNYKVTLVRGGDSIDGVVTLSIAAGEYNSSYSYLKEGAVVFEDKSWDGTKENLSVEKIDSFEITNGELKGYQTVSEETQKYQDQLNGLARAIAYAVNTVHTTDTVDQNKNSNTDFFVGEDGTGELSGINAGNITVNQEIIDDVKNINAGKVLDGTGDEGDGERALAMAQLRNARLPVQNFMSETYNPDGPDGIEYTPSTMKFTNVDSGNTFEGYFKDIIAGLGISTEEADKMVENQDALTGQLIQRRYSISGVSMDEEIANLIQFQHAYQANANVISTLTVMLDTLINRMGV